MNKIKIFFVIIILLNLNNSVGGDAIEIKVKIQEEIITNLDIENEIKYLFFLNPKLQDLERNRVYNIAKESLVNEIIKKKELQKFFDFNENEKLTKVVERNLFLRKKIKNREEFLIILKTLNLDYDDIKEKLYIEALWNRLIYQKYSENVVVNKVELKKKIVDQIEREKEKFSYNISEIFFEDSQGETLDEKISKINNSIKKIGFENTANIYSISNTSKKGGLIGWINELQLSSKIVQKIKNLNINEVSNPIKLQNGYILIKLNDKKAFNQKIDLDEQLKKLINNETNRQLNNFSTIYYKRLKKNIEINVN